MNIKQAVLSTIEQHIDAQQAKGLAKYGETIDGVSVDDYAWKNEIIEELIDGLQYQQKEIARLERDKEAAELHGEMYRLRYMQVVEGEGNGN